MIRLVYNASGLADNDQRLPVSVRLYKETARRARGKVLRQILETVTGIRREELETRLRCRSKVGKLNRFWRVLPEVLVPLSLTLQFSGGCYPVEWISSPREMQGIPFIAYHDVYFSR